MSLLLGVTGQLRNSALDFGAISQRRRRRVAIASEPKHCNLKKTTRCFQSCFSVFGSKYGSSFLTNTGIWYELCSGGSKGEGGFRCTPSPVELVPPPMTSA